MVSKPLISSDSFRYLGTKKLSEKEMLEHDYLLSSKDFGYRVEVYEAWETYRRVFPNKDSTIFCKNWKIAREELSQYSPDGLSLFPNKTLNSCSLSDSGTTTLL